MSATTQALLGSSFDDWQGIYSLMSLYGVHILVGALLSAVTIYRREMSCNRVFHDDEEADNPEASSNIRATMLVSDQVLGPETEELLEGAGSYCSGQPILTLASLWLDSFSQADQDAATVAASRIWMTQHDHDLNTSELLERAGNYGEPILAAAMALFLLKNNKQEIPKAPLQQETQCDPFTNKLPHDVHAHICSFLHPKDVVTLSCVSKTYHEVVDQSETASAIWKTLWQRDYAWIANDWNVGQQALERSNVDPEKFVLSKDFYFTFGQTYVNYVLAGQNTMERCLVGLHFQIYDITNFLDIHPGSPDTLMVYAGKDSTRFFEEMGHSLGARRTAQQFCVVADCSSRTGNDWGLRPTQHTVLASSSKSNTRVWNRTENNLLLGRKQTSRRGTLQRIRSRLDREEEQFQRRLSKQYQSDPHVLGQVNPYHDPFRQEWKVWYTSTDLQTIFLPAS